MTRPKEPILCPRGEIVIDCPRWADHLRDRTSNGIEIFLPLERVERIRDFLDKFSQFRSGAPDRIENAAELRLLPFVDQSTGVWRPRQLDLRLVKSLVHDTKHLDILEIGPWNCWLTHHLEAWGHSVTAVDLFLDEWDGLGSKTHHPGAAWRSIQMDLEDLHVVEKRFDLIVINRCLAYFQDPVDMVERLSERLHDGGRLVATGLAFYGNPRRVRFRLEQASSRFRDQFGTEMGIRSIRGHLDRSDEHRLQGVGLHLGTAREHRLKNLLAVAARTRPRLRHGVLRVDRSKGSSP